MLNTLFIFSIFSVAASYGYKSDLPSYRCHDSGPCSGDCYCDKHYSQTGCNVDGGRDGCFWTKRSVSGGPYATSACRCDSPEVNCYLKTKSECLAVPADGCSWEGGSEKGAYCNFNTGVDSDSMEQHVQELAAEPKAAKGEIPTIFFVPASCPIVPGDILVFQDMHDGDQKQVTLKDGQLSILPYGNTQTWSTSATFDFRHCNASIDFNVPNKPSPPPINLTATFWSLSSFGDSKLSVIFNDNTATLAPAATPLNAWIQTST